MDSLGQITGPPIAGPLTSLWSRTFGSRAAAARAAAMSNIGSPAHAQHVGREREDAGARIARSSGRSHAHGHHITEPGPRGPRRVSNGDAGSRRQPHRRLLHVAGERAARAASRHAGSSGRAARAGGVVRARGVRCGQDECTLQCGMSCVCNGLPLRDAGAATCPWWPPVAAASTAVHAARARTHESATQLHTRAGPRPEPRV